MGSITYQGGGATQAIASFQSLSGGNYARANFATGGIPVQQTIIKTQSLAPKTFIEKQQDLSNKYNIITYKPTGEIATVPLSFESVRDIAPQYQTIPQLSTQRGASTMTTSELIPFPEKQAYSFQGGRGPSYAELSLIPNQIIQQNEARQDNIKQIQNVNKILQQNYGQVALGYGPIYTAKQTIPVPVYSSSGKQIGTKNEIFTDFVRDQRGQTYDIDLKQRQDIYKLANLTQAPLPQFTFGVTYGKTPNEIIDQPDVGSPRVLANQQAILERLGLAQPLTSFSQTGTSKAPLSSTTQGKIKSAMPNIPLTTELTEDQMKPPQTFVSNYPLQYNSQKQLDQVTKNIDKSIAINVNQRPTRGAFGMPNKFYASEKAREDFYKGLLASPEETLLGSIGQDISKRIKGQEPTAFSKAIKEGTPERFLGESFQYIGAALPIKGIPFIKTFGGKIVTALEPLIKPFRLETSKKSISELQRGAYQKYLARYKREGQESISEQEQQKLIKDLSGIAEGTGKQKIPSPDSYKNVKPRSFDLYFGNKRVAEQIRKNIQDDTARIGKPAQNIDKEQQDFFTSVSELAKQSFSKTKINLGKGTGKFIEGGKPSTSGKPNTFTSSPPKPKPKVEGTSSGKGTQTYVLEPSSPRSFTPQFTTTKIPNFESVVTLGGSLAVGLSISEVLKKQEKDLQLPDIRSRFDQKPDSRTKIKDKGILDVYTNIDVGQKQFEKLSQPQKQKFFSGQPQFPFSPTTESPVVTPVSIPQFDLIQPPRFFNTFRVPPLGKVFGFGGVSGNPRKGKSEGRVFKVFDVAKVPAGKVKVGVGYYEVSGIPNFEIQKKRKTKDEFFDIY